LAERELPYTSAAIERDHPPPELLSLNPLGRLPIWVTDQGRSVFGSNTIVTFLEASVPGKGLFPADALQRARVAMAEELVNDGLLQPLIRLDRELAERAAGSWDMEVYRTETQRVRRTLGVFEQLLGGRPWLVGDALTPADLALAQPLTIVERFGLELAGFPGLQDLAERLGKRPSILAARRPPSTARAPA